MRKLPELKVTFIDDESISKEEKEKALSDCYDILFKETVKMMEKSSKLEHIAFLKKYPWWKGKGGTSN